MTWPGAGDGLEALARFRGAPARYAAVLLDLTMPNFDGMRTLQEIHSIRPGTVVVIMTGHSSSEVTSQFPPGSLGGIIQKPFTAAIEIRTQ